MEDLTETPQKQNGLAQIVSKFNFGQELWFIEGLIIHKGVLCAIKGNMTEYDTSPSIELTLQETHGHLGRHISIEEYQCFATKEELINSILAQ